MKKTIEVILQHGWAFDSSCFAGWLPHLHETPDCQIMVQRPDRGYFGNAVAAQPFSQRDSVKVVVAHSLGLHLLDNEILKSADLLVLAAAFRHFHGGTRIEQKRSSKTVLAMLKRFETAATDVVSDFYSRCYHPLLTSQMLLMRSVSALDVELLMQDLHMLNSSEFELNNIVSIPRILLVHGSEDLIVPVSQSQELHDSLPNSSLVLFEGAGHALPLTHIAPVWISLRNMLRHLRTVKT